MLGQQLRTLQQSHGIHHQTCMRSSCSSWRSRRSRSRDDVVACSSAVTTQPGALILEADGVVADMHMDGHRVAFNRAFHELGYDCTNWTPAIYHDLLAKGDGTGEGLVAAYYAIVGWPTFLPTSEQRSELCSRLATANAKGYKIAPQSMFAGNVHKLKQKHLRKMLDKEQLPLREGVKQVVCDAAAAGAKIALISQTCSDPQDDVITYIMTQLPTEVTVYPASIHTHQEDSNDTHNIRNIDDDVSDMLDPRASLAAATGRVKQRGAREFVERISSALEGKSDAVPVRLDLSLQSTGTSNSTTAPWLAAVAATLGVTSSSCIAVASSSDIITAAAAAGMLAIAVPRKLAYAATYPAAAAKFEGWGPGYCTWQKLAAIWSKQQQQQQQRRQ